MLFKIYVSVQKERMLIIIACFFLPLNLLEVYALGPLYILKAVFKQLIILNSFMLVLVLQHNFNTYNNNEKYVQDTVES